MDVEITLFSQKSELLLQISTTSINAISRTQSWDSVRWDDKWLLQTYQRGKQQTRHGNKPWLKPCHWILNLYPRVWIQGASYLFVNPCSVCLGVCSSPGQNYKEIGFLLVLDEICMSKKKIKRIDQQNKAEAGQKATQHALHIKHIHLYCMVTESFTNMNDFFAVKELWAIFGFTVHLPSVSSGESFLNYHIIKPFPVFDSVYDKWLIMVISEIEHWALLCTLIVVCKTESS